MNFIKKILDKSFYSKPTYFGTNETTKIFSLNKSIFNNELRAKYRLFFHLNSHIIFLYFFLLILLFQIIFWSKTENIKPKFNILPNAPSHNLIKIISFGDNEFLFRILALRIQNAGDIFGGFSSLNNYDYSLLYQWLKILDSLNSKSNLTPSFASYYFGHTSSKEKAIYIAKYLEEHSVKNINEKWWWMFQAIYIATNSLQNKELALKFAYELSKANSGAPLWTKQMPAFINLKYGNRCAAFKIISNIITESNAAGTKIKAKELNFMRYFINERLSEFEKQKFNPYSCK